MHGWAVRRCSHPLIEDDHAVGVTQHPGLLCRPTCHKGLPQSASILTSPCRHCIFPRPERRVEWSNLRAGIEGLLFCPCRLCRRCASDASEESVSDPGSIGITTTDNSFVIDPV